MVKLQKPVNFPNIFLGLSLKLLAHNYYRSNLSFSLQILAHEAS